MSTFRTRVIFPVQDNLSAHTKASLWEVFPAAEARRLFERFEWRDTSALDLIRSGHRFAAENATNSRI
jgi:hypothetical protein